MDAAGLPVLDYETEFFDDVARFRITKRLNTAMGRKTTIEIPKPPAMAKAGEESTLGACKPKDKKSPDAHTRHEVPSHAFASSRSRVASMRLMKAKMR